MNKPERLNIDGKTLIPVREYAASLLSRRGKPVRVQYIYKLIKEHQQKGRCLNFDYTEIERTIYIVE